MKCLINQCIEIFQSTNECSRHRDVVIQSTVKNNRTKFDEHTSGKKKQSNLSVLRKMHAFRKQNTPSKHLTLSKLNKIIYSIQLGRLALYIWVSNALSIILSFTYISLFLVFWYLVEGNLSNLK